MDFVTWWFDKHYILSTLCTPMLSLAWGAHNGLVARSLISLLFVLLGGDRS